MMEIPTELARYLRACERIVVLTGAGVSAESGVPTFRDALTGLWAKYDPEELASPAAFRRNPGLVWRWYEWRRQLVASTQPNAGHLALTAMQQLANEFTLITQNVDGLHQAAGSREVIELHGRLGRYKCFAAGHPAEQVANDLQEPPLCHRCGSPLRPDVVWFGEQLPQEEIERAARAAAAADAIFAVGTAAMVYPAAQLPLLAQQRGALFVEVNTNPTGLSPIADYVLQGRSGDVLPAVVAAVWPTADPV